MMPTLGELDLGSILIIFVCFFVGSIGGAYYALRKQLRRKKQTVTSTPNVEP